MSDRFSLLETVIVWSMVLGFIIAVSTSSFMFRSCTETRKCESLQAQGVKAVIADTLLSKECIVLQREVMMRPENE